METILYFLKAGIALALGWTAVSVLLTVSVLGLIAILAYLGRR